jgi:hypothetical protein
MSFHIFLFKIEVSDELDMQNQLQKGDRGHE